MNKKTDKIRPGATPWRTKGRGQQEQSVKNSRVTTGRIKENDICAEVGVWRGALSSYILKQNPSELHLIDPWIHQDYKKRGYSQPQLRMDKIYNNVVEKFKDDSRVTIHRKLSIEAQFPEEYFDWVYIDADHSYEAVLADLKHYYPLVKKGGFLCGDDYGLWNNLKHKPNWTGFGSDGGSMETGFGPKPAVDKFVKDNDLKLSTKGWQYSIEVK